MDNLNLHLNGTIYAPPLVIWSCGRGIWSILLGKD